MDKESLIDILLTRNPHSPLVPSEVWNRELTVEIDLLYGMEMLKAGLHLLNDDIDRCHHIAQERPTPEGNYWHAILHRREPDYSNSKYWYRKVGEHPVFSLLREEFSDWDPFTFVDWCEGTSRGTGEKSESWLRDVQMKEMAYLLKHVEGERN